MLTARERLIRLNLIPDVTAANLRRLLEAFKDLDQLWRAGPQELQRAAGIGPAIAQRIASSCRDEAPLARELALAERLGVKIVTLEDDGYPSRLKTIADPPLALYVRGTLLPSDECAVAIVGTRRASLYGLQCAERLGYDLALRGVTVVSGLARGIDGAAHRGALKTPGRTLAVLGSGISRVYPPEHAPIADAIVQQGALISEYPMEAGPLARHFPRRNRIISGLSLGLVVVEAPPKSGALISADCALEQNREVFAVPGPITTVMSQGTHELLKQGARVVTSVEDILEELHLCAGTPSVSSRGEASPEPELATEPGYPAKGGVGEGRTPACPAFRVHPDGGRSRSAPEDSRGSVRPVQLPEPEERVFACVNAQQPTDADAIAAQSGLELPDLSSALLQLELKRLIQQLPGRRFIRRSTPPWS